MSCQHYAKMTLETRSKDRLLNDYAWPIGREQFEEPEIPTDRVLGSIDRNRQESAVRNCGLSSPVINKVGFSNVVSTSSGSDGKSFLKKNAVFVEIFDSA